MAMAFTTRHRSVYRQFIIGSRRCPWKQLYRLNRSLLFSQSAREDPALAWARSNPRLAQECLNPPSADSRGFSPGMAMDSLESYLEWREWTVPNELEEPRGGVLGDPAASKEHATALISHILSAPLTLASHFGRLSEHRGSDGTVDDGVVELGWCCVGARAEASIPTAYWEEFLRFSRASMSSKESSPLSKNKRLELSIDFIGPDIAPKLAEQSMSLAEGRDGHETEWSLSLRGYHRGLFHDIPAFKGHAQTWDAYLLFNPGLGHPNLRASWEPTLNAILRNPQRERRPGKTLLLLTAHSERDMARDAAILGDVYELENVEYRENPFASRVAYKDPFEKHDVVRPNHYVATVVI